MKKIEEVKKEFEEFYETLALWSNENFDKHWEFWEAKIEELLREQSRKEICTNCGEEFDLDFVGAFCVDCFYDKGYINSLLDVIKDMTDENDCWFDHHGYCQEHGWSSTGKECPNSRAKKILNAKIEQ